MTEDEFTCAECGGTFKKSWTDEEAMQEARGLFGPSVDYTDNVLVCDDCWNDLIPQVQAAGFIQGVVTDGN